MIGPFSETVLLYTVALMVATHFAVNIVFGLRGGTTRFSYMMYWGLAWGFALAVGALSLQVLPQVV